MLASTRAAWKRKPVMIRAAIITLTGGALIAIVNHLAPEALWYLHNIGALKVLDLRPAMIDSKPAAEVILWNQSQKGVTVTSLELGLHEGKIPVHAAAGAIQIYKLSAQIEVLSRERMSLQGTLLSPSQQMSHSILGSFLIDGRGKWSLEVTLPIQEELAAGRSLTIELELPKSMKIIGPEQGRMPPSYLHQYTSGDPPNEFHFLGLLRKTGTVQAVVTLLYGGEKSAMFHRLMNFGGKAGGAQ